MKRKIRMLLLVTLSLLFLVGFGKKTVELLSDKKLIDLNAAISICLPGADSLEKDDGNTQTGQTPVPTAAPTKTPSDPAEITKEITISLRDDVVTYGSGERINMAKLEMRIRQDNREYVLFRLVDDFAEAHAYRKVLEILEKLEEAIGVRFTAD